MDEIFGEDLDVEAAMMEQQIAESLGEDDGDDLPWNPEWD